jgi:lipopolysaccharide biosynthesis glycosyltransferase
VSRLLICTRCDDNIKNQSDITHPFMQDYAEKCGANFMILDHKTDCTHEEGKWHYRILILNEVFEVYDRILHIDTDAIITPWAENIFNIVPEHMIGTVYEDVGTRAQSRRECIQRAQKAFGDIGWKEGYINTGFFLTSKSHREIFSKINGRYYEDWGHDDVHLGYQINKHSKDVCELSYKWNHMTMFSESWNGSPDRFKSNVIHYAGSGSFDGLSKIEQMREDVKKINVLLSKDS